MKMISRLIALGSFLVLAGCGTWTAESYLHEDIQGDTFNACLAREYQDRATSEAYVDCNWVDTATIVAKGRAAAAGETVLPFDPATKGVLSSDLPELQDARSKLMAALDNGGRTDRGCECAKAQRYYDGWVEQASDNKLGVNGSYFGGEGGPVQPDRVEAEKAAFYEALTACALQAPSGPWTIYFGFDKYNLTPEAQSVIDQIVAETTGALSVVGHTDTSGSNAYNQALGQRRADSVSNALTAQGKELCSAVSRGETELAVQTGDGVREPLNRRAVVAGC
ncbi:OmpA family protein [Parvibaculum sp.]|uniref:OmpA family protein n=1 Tax=Parvibaculum sp. TaxID=2024848 RepID=UPI00271CFF91|nr:OmpA family protein [Parvibaculum sp.]MDO9125559.1 OmpA family protein [Parvibaculum sp.]MDP1628478.1 OmpA family protein [Parvibaculum sp.]MDP2151810.1 OmpA family protein [Parvibaculum sp.]MDP3326933.1 OmpA family protein [Parvibaculum sp.]